MMNTDKTKRRPAGRISALLLAAALLLDALTLTGCGSDSISMKLPDGTKIKIEYRSAVPFERSPVFSATSRGLVMSFNDIDWYTANIVSADEAAALTDGLEYLGSSTNLDAYAAADGAEFAYYYLMRLEGTDEAYIVFNTDTDPYGSSSIGNDFDRGVKYTVNGVETLPDTEGFVAAEE